MTTRKTKPTFRPAALGIAEEFAPLVQACVQELEQDGIRGKALRRLFRRLTEQPGAFRDHPVLGRLAVMLGGNARRATLVTPLRTEPAAPWTSWGENLDPAAVTQMENGCALPVSVRGALMPDAHVGYGLPIGGVLAVRDAVIPYGVGMDIACRVKLSVFALSPDLLDSNADELAHILNSETRFGVGSAFRPAKDHPVMREDWGISPVTKRMRDTAQAQLGTSGSGNHFVEWGALDISQDLDGLAAGNYLALLSHSGSRGTGGEVARYYSSLARKLRPDLPQHLRHLAWLDMHSDSGQEYWAAMQLMGRYSAANHFLIHQSVARALGTSPVFSVENHHNFAWQEEHDGQRVVVHRKGATPAGAGVLGVIPGTMVDSAFLVQGLGNPLALCSAAHGAGRAMSRQEAQKRFRSSDLEAILSRHKVRLLSAGLDEAPMAYKNVHEVMAAQQDLVRILGTFTPRIVKMAA